MKLFGYRPVQIMPRVLEWGWDHIGLLFVFALILDPLLGLGRLAVFVSLYGTLASAYQIGVKDALGDYNDDA